MRRVLSAPICLTQQRLLCACALPGCTQVFEDTSLSSVYSCTNQPSQQQLDRMQPLLDAAAAALGRPVQLPTITHAPGYDKYRHLAPGEAAHEAGYGE
jgi:hypothetical protein